MSGNIRRPRGVLPPDLQQIMAERAMRVVDGSEPVPAVLCRECGQPVNARCDCEPKEGRP